MMNDREKTKEQLIEEVTELRQNLNALVDHLPEAFFIVDAPDVKIRVASRDSQQMLGTSWAELDGIADDEHFEHYQVFHPDGTAVSVEELPLSRALSSGEIIRNEEWLMQSKDGRKFPTLCQAGPVRDQAGTIRGAVICWHDISERKRAEEAVRESEERYRMLAETTMDAIGIHDRNGTLLYGNRAGAVSLGLDPDKLVGMTQQDLFPPEVAQKHLEAIATVFRTGELLELADEVCLHDSGEMWRQTRLIPLRDEHGQVASVMSVSHDITARKQAEEALKKAHDELELRVKERTAELAAINEQLHREIEERKRVEAALRQSEEMYRTLVEVSPDAVIMVDPDQKLLFASQRAAAMFGYDSAKDLCKAKVLTLAVEEDRPRLAANISLLFQQHVRQQTEYAGARPDGSRFTAEVSSALLRDDKGRPKGFMAVIRDVTARKQIEEALRQSEEKHRGLLEACPDAVVMTGLDGTIRFASRQTWELVGLADQEELAGQSVFDYLIESDRPRLAENIGHLTKVGIRRNTEYTVLRRDGAPVPVEICSAANRDVAGQPMAVMAVVRDITERKQAQELLQREYRTLKHLLQSSDHERQVIAYEIHDGLAQQLAGAIMQFETYFYQKDSRPEKAAKAYDAAMTMLRQGHSESRRLISGVRPPILDESGVVAAIAHLASDLSGPKAPKIKYFSAVAFDRLVPTVENAIYRIAQEGLTNACRHSRSENVRIALVQREDRVRIEIRDWGVGFDVKAVQENRYGLEGIRQRVRLLGGKCSIRSKPRKGTRIVVELPVVERQ
jgi:PAS domain S-box-containing protein